MKDYSLSNEHYELKFIIPTDLIEPIIKYASIYCEPDPYSKKYKDGFYPINSLYFDTFNYKFLRKKLLNQSKRYNIRVRSYGYDPEPPYFFEVKQRNSIFMSKLRTTVNSKNWADIFFNLFDNPEWEKDIANPLMKEFLLKVFLNNAAPKVLICYRRLALLSTINEYARLTFDRDLCFKLENEYIFNRNESDLTYFAGFFPTAAGSNIILELKCRNDMPLWMMDLIRKFNLQRSSFSKYASGMLESFRLNPVMNNIFEMKSVFY